MGLAHCLRAGIDPDVVCLIKLQNTQIVDSYAFNRPVLSDFIVGHRKRLYSDPDLSGFLDQVLGDRLDWFEAG
jgi:hypothetical protein